MATLWRSEDARGAAQLFRERCSTCHDLPDMSRFDKGSMAGIVRTMRERNGADEVITEKEAHQITRYLEAMAAK